MKPTTLGGLFLQQCATHEEETAIVFFEADGNRRTISYNRLRDVSQRLALGLRRAGFRSGTRAVIVADNSPEWIFVYFAIQVLGGIDICLHPGMDVHEVVNTVVDSHAEFAFVGPEFLYDALWQTPARVHLMRWKKERRQRTLGAVLEPRRLFRRKPTGFEERLADDPASVVLRKGASVGRPRGVVLTHRAILANMEQLGSVIPTTELESILSPLPLWHSSGRMALHLALQKGSAFVLSSPTTVRQDLALNEAHVAVLSADQLTGLYNSVLTGLPGESVSRIVFRRLYLFAHDWMSFLFAFSVQRVAQFRSEDESPLLRILTLAFWATLRLLTIPGELLFARELRSIVGKKLRIILAGGSRIPGNVDRFFQSLGVSILEGYWMTEASHVIATRLLQFTGQRTRLVHGTVGPMLPGTELRLLNSLGDDVSRTPGAVGRVQVRGPQIMQGYFHDAEATTETVDAQGWLRTGDTGRMTTTGELVLLGRGGVYQ